MELESQGLSSRLEPQVQAEGVAPHPHTKDLPSSDEHSMAGSVTRVKSILVPTRTTRKVESSPDTTDDAPGKTMSGCTEMEVPSRAKHQLLLLHHRADLQSMLARLEECEVRVWHVCTK